jgi:hypothetical protein
MGPGRIGIGRIFAAKALGHYTLPVSATDRVNASISQNAIRFCAVRDMGHPPISAQIFLRLTLIYR